MTNSTASAKITKRGLTYPHPYFKEGGWFFWKGELFVLTASFLHRKPGQNDADQDKRKGKVLIVSMNYNKCKM